MSVRRISSLEASWKIITGDTRERDLSSVMSAGTNSDIKVGCEDFNFNKARPNISMFAGDRTKHLKNLHGIHKSLETGNGLPHTTIVVNGSSENFTSKGPSPPTIQTDKIPFLSSITEETNSSISSFHSNTEMSDSASVSGSTLGESPNKFDPLDVGILTPPVSTVRTATNPLQTNGVMPSSLQETVTMSIDEVMQYAQPIADFTF